MDPVVFREFSKWQCLDKWSSSLLFSSVTDSYSYAGTTGFGSCAVDSKAGGWDK